jgi:hypothetical protein
MARRGVRLVAEVVVGAEALHELDLKAARMAACSAHFQCPELRAAHSRELAHLLLERRASEGVEWILESRQEQLLEPRALRRELRAQLGAELERRGLARRRALQLLQ